MGHRFDHTTHDHDRRRQPRGAEARFRRGPHQGDFGLGPAFAGGGFLPPEFGFGPRRGGPGSRARRGDVRSAILSLLAEQPTSGYGLIKAIAARTEGAWRPSPGSIYPTLQQLVDEELVVGSGGEGRRSEYSLTEAGRGYVAEHEEDIARAWQQAAGGEGRAAREDLAAFRESVGRLMRVVGQFDADATPAQRTAAVEKMDELRRALYLLLAE